MFCLIFIVLLRLFVSGDGAVDICGVKHIHIPKFVSLQVFSPGYETGTYPLDKRCDMTVDTEEGMRLRIDFEDLDLEVSNICQADYLKLIDGTNSTSPLLGMFCGNQHPGSFLTTRNELTVIFYSDFMVSGRGFRLTITSTHSPSLCKQREIQCRNRKCVLQDVVCDGTDDCGDATDEEKCGHPVPSVSKCGLPAIPPLLEIGRNRVVGGQEARPGSWPWQADFQVKFLYPNGHVCGGTLINAQWVLTASHCFDNSMDKTGWRVHFGNHHKFQKDPFEQVRYIAKYIVYPNTTDEQFRENPVVNLNSDITLVKLTAPVQLTNYVHPACLPAEDDPLATGTFCYATGWGETRGTASSDVLKQMSSVVHDGEKCDSSFWQFNSSTMVCSGDLKGGNGVCHGDSGGPLVCQKGEKWSIEGVASYVIDNTIFTGLCGMQDRPNVFVKVSYYLDWIKDTVKKFS